MLAIISLLYLVIERKMDNSLMLVLESFSLDQTFQALGWDKFFLWDAGGRIFYDYNTLNALADKSYSSANELGNDRPVQMVYNSIGQRISMEDITGERTYTYDSLGRLKTAPEPGMGDHRTDLHV